MKGWQQGNEGWVLLAQLVVVVFRDYGVKEEATGVAQLGGVGQFGATQLDDFAAHVLSCEHVGGQVAESFVGYIRLELCG